MRVRRIDHIGIAIEDEDQARSVLEGIFGFKPPHKEVVEDQGVRTLIYQVGDTKVELLLATSEESPIARHLAKRGQGLHHLAFEVDDLKEACAMAEDQGLELIDDEPRPGVEGSQIMFVHPKGTFGTLLELVEFPDEPLGAGGP